MKLLVRGCLKIFSVLILVVYWLSSAMYAQNDVGINYKNYKNVLEKYVDKNGLVNYRALKDDRASLDSFIESLKNIEAKEYEDWKDSDKIAFWINTYNILTLRVIIDYHPLEKLKRRSRRYPENSIKQIPGAWDKIKFTVMGEEVVLDDIEHNILRKDFDEPRIHVSLVCAAKGCPNLRREYYSGESLDRQLDDQTRTFLSDEKKFKIDRDKKVVFLSSIFKWYGKDFINKFGKKNRIKSNKKENAVLNFVLDYLDKSDRKYILESDYRVKYLHYDWILNKKENKEVR